MVVETHCASSTGSSQAGLTTTVFHVRPQTQTFTAAAGKSETEVFTTFQVFRALNAPLHQKNITSLSVSLTDCIADGTDAASQSWAIEILLTMLQTCEIFSGCLNKDETK